MRTSKRINLVLFGIGNVGSTLINQIIANKILFWERQRLQINIPIIANSKLAFIDIDGVSKSWTTDFDQFSVPYKIEDIIRYIKSHELDNCIAVDATASSDFVKHYFTLIENGFHIVSANKVANTLDQPFYDKLRETLEKNNKQFLYETNVGAGLPVIDTVKKLHKSGDKILKIRGVFSGSLSYIFNTFSESDLSFSNVLKGASKLGLTEPDAREDLSGKDVARKLLILARELDLKKELKDVKTESLVPNHLNGKTTLNQFKSKLHTLDKPLQLKKAEINKHQVLRYIAELDVLNNTLEVKLKGTNKSEPLGRLKGTDSFFEIYSENYKDSPLIIQGAGAGKAVTANGLLTDLLKLSNRICL